MNEISLLLGLPAIGAAIGLFVYVVLSGRKAATPSIAVDGGTALAIGAKHSTPSRPKDATPLMDRLGRLGAKLTRAGYVQRMQHRLDLAGNPRAWTPERLLAFKALGLLLGASLGFLFGVNHGLGTTVILAAAVGALGYFLPDVLVRNLGEKRQVTIQRALPDAMDMLTVCVEAGMGFDAALARVARNLTGPVTEECARVLQEMQVGLSRTDALRALAGRTNVPELRTFVSAMVQAAELGVSIGDVLREQSREMRIRRRQRAEERAQKLQVKILMPLILCLLPAMFVVVLGPAGINIVNFFAKAH